MCMSNVVCLFRSYERVKIPEWAHEETLAKILDEQNGGSNPRDPEEIFTEFSTSVLDIFDNEEPSRDRRESRCERDVSE